MPSNFLWNSSIRLSRSSAMPLTSTLLSVSLAAFGLPRRRLTAPTLMHGQHSRNRDCDCLHGHGRPLRRDAAERKRPADGLTAAVSSERVAAVRPGGSSELPGLAFLG